MKTVTLVLALFSTAIVCPFAAADVPPAVTTALTQIDNDNAAMVATQSTLTASQATLTAAQAAVPAASMPAGRFGGRVGNNATVLAARSALATSQAAWLGANTAVPAVVTAQSSVTTASQAVATAAQKVRTDRQVLEQALDAAYGARGIPRVGF
jgi:hypothetical protein